MKECNSKLVQCFRHIVPYINAYRGKTFIIMLDGETIKYGNFSSIINDIGLLHSLGVRLVVVYGACPQINTSLKKRNIKIVYHKYLRITDLKSLEQVKKEAGRLQLDITAHLSMSLTNTPLQGANINVVSGNFIVAQPLGVDDGVDYCYSGRIRRIDKNAIHYQLKNRAIVLIGPVAVSVTGESFNLISEEIAAQLSIELKAEKIIGFCKNQGVMNYKNEVISELLLNDIKNTIKRLEEKGDYISSKVRFLKSAIKSCKSGVNRIHLISYHKNGSLLQELFSRGGIGTQMVMESVEKIRRANINDVRGILELIRPLEKKGILVRRSREQLEVEVDKFTIIEYNNLTIACVALYPFLKEKIGEMACLVVHPDYRNLSRGDLLLKHIKIHAQEMYLEKIFVLTTQSIHWFQERGFMSVDIETLPESKKKMYNYQRGSKILMIDVF